MNKLHVYSIHVVVVQSVSRVQLFVTPWTAAGQAPLSLTTFWSLHKLMSMESMMPFNHLIWRDDSLEKKDPDAGEDWGQEEKGTTEDEMVGWHHQVPSASVLRTNPKADRFTGSWEGRLPSNRA